ncbi:MAG: YtxH domain-containing protein [Georgenia sp.]
MGKFSFVAGAAVGYVFGTRAGRAQYERLKKAGAAVWSNPRVQGGVQKVEQKVGDAARERTAAMTDKVAATVKDKIRTTGRPGSGAANSDTGHANSGTGNSGTGPAGSGR